MDRPVPGRDHASVEAQEAPLMMRAEYGGASCAAQSVMGAVQILLLNDQLLMGPSVITDLNQVGAKLHLWSSTRRHIKYADVEEILDTTGSSRFLSCTPYGDGVIRQADFQPVLPVMLRDTHEDRRLFGTPGACLWVSTSQQNLKLRLQSILNALGQRQPIAASQLARYDGQHACHCAAC